MRRFWYLLWHVYMVGSANGTTINIWKTELFDFRAPERAWLLNISAISGEWNTKHLPVMESLVVEAGLIFQITSKLCGYVSFVIAIHSEKQSETIISNVFNCSVKEPYSKWWNLLYPSSQSRDVMASYVTEPGIIKQKLHRTTNLLPLAYDCIRALCVLLLISWLCRSFFTPTAKKYSPSWPTSPWRIRRTTSRFTTSQLRWIPSPASTPWKAQGLMEVMNMPPWRDCRDI